MCGFCFIMENTEENKILLKFVRNLSILKLFDVYIKGERNKNNL